MIPDQQSPNGSPGQTPSALPMSFGSLWGGAGSSELLAGIYNASNLTSEDSASNMNGNDSEAMDQTEASEASNDSNSNMQHAGVMAN